MPKAKLRAHDPCPFLVCCLSVDQLWRLSVNSFTVSLSGFPEFTRPAVTWECPAYWVLNKKLLEKKAKATQTTTTFCLAMSSSDGLCFFICHRPPHLEICVKNINGESRFRMNERRWCLLNFALGLIPVSLPRKDERGPADISGQGSLKISTQTTITKCFFVKH